MILATRDNIEIGVMFHAAIDDDGTWPVIARCSVTYEDWVQSSLSKGRTPKPFDVTGWRFYEIDVLD